MCVRAVLTTQHQRRWRRVVGSRKASRDTEDVALPGGIGNRPRNIVDIPRSDPPPDRRGVLDNRLAAVERVDQAHADDSRRVRRDRPDSFRARRGELRSRRKLKHVLHDDRIRGDDRLGRERDLRGDVNSLRRGDNLWLLERRCRPHRRPLV